MQKQKLIICIVYATALALLAILVVQPSQTFHNKCKREFTDGTFYHYVPPVPLKSQKEWKVIEAYKGKVTEYNVGDPNQCDDTPCISANGENICKAIELGYGRCATNKYKFGTILRIDGFICTVTDRMNARYKNGEVDIALSAGKKLEALKYGVQIKNIEVIN